MTLLSLSVYKQPAITQTQSQPPDGELGRHHGEGGHLLPQLDLSISHVALLILFPPQCRRCSRQGRIKIMVMLMAASLWVLPTTNKSLASSDWDSTLSPVTDPARDHRGDKVRPCQNYLTRGSLFLSTHFHFLKRFQSWLWLD